jgi:hypothetical protein
VARKGLEVVEMPDADNVYQPANEADADEIDETLLTEAPDDWKFETVEDEAPTAIVFDTFGDVFVGQYEELRRIVPDKDDPFELFIFRGRDGRPYSVSAYTKMMKAMEKVSPGSWVRLTYVKDLASTKGQPMKDFKVEVKL